MNEQSSTAETLRARMVERLRRMPGGVPDEVAEAMSVVPRHLFVPEVALDEAYGAGAVVTHRDAEGVATSSASAPGTVAGMLEQARVLPGQQVLEVGAGTGYNAALLAHLVGPAGSVTTIEFDPLVAEEAHAHLAAHGTDQVNVVTGDGMLGAPGRAPFDRILVTAGAWDIPAAWWEQLAPDGRLVLPLRLLGLTRTVAFERDGEVLRSVSVVEDGFIPMKGMGAMAEQNVPIGPGPDLVLRVDDGRPVDAGALAGALRTGPQTAWAPVEASWAWMENHDLWLATLPGFCRVFVDRDAIAAGRVPRPTYGGWAWGLFSGGSVAYLTARRTGGIDDMPLLQVGACGFGPDGADLAEQLVTRVVAWQRDAGNGTDLAVEVRRKHAGSAIREPAPRDESALLTVDKAENTFVVHAVPRAATVTA